MNHSFSVLEAFKQSWRDMRTHSRVLFAAVLALFAAQIALEIVEHVLGNTAPGILGKILLAATLVVLGTGLTLITLRVAKGEHASYKDLVPPWGIIWRFMCASICAGLIAIIPVCIAMATAYGVLGHELSRAIMVGFEAESFAPLRTIPQNALISLSIITALGLAASMYLGLRYSLVRFAVLDGESIRGSLRASAHLTHGKMLPLIGFFILMGLLNILGGVTIVGLLVTVPLTTLAFAHVYLKLKAR